MAFEKLAAVVASGRRGMPASVTLTCQGGGRPACSIAISQAFAVKAGFAEGEKFDLLIGTDDDEGVARLVRNTNGLITAHTSGKGGLKFWCGHIERFGTESQKKQFCAAEIGDPGTIEITLPPWALV